MKFVFIFARDAFSVNSREESVFIIVCIDLHCVRSRSSSCSSRSSKAVAAAEAVAAVVMAVDCNC